jgi:C-terminal processing protease CtpA/Prc
MSNSRRMFFIATIGVAAFILVIVFYFQPTRQDLTVEEQVTKDISTDRLYSNLEAFGKLYGYIRYFHPSDEVDSLSAWEWNRFVEYGVSKVKHAKNESELIETLEELFFPIAPTFKLSEDNQAEKHQEKDIKDGNVVAWQHYGLGVDEKSDSLYKSQRTTAIVKDGKYELENNRLFKEFPSVNETISEKISEKIYTSIPLTLYQSESGTVGSDDASKKQFEELKGKLNSLDTITKEEDTRYAGIIVTWNVLQHFYPYFHVTNSNWESQLLPALKDVSDDENKEDYMYTVMRLLEKTKDGHALHTFDSFNLLNPKLPFIVEKLEGELVVTVASEESGLIPGDIILSIDNNNPDDVLREYGEVIPGSPHYKEVITTQMIRHEASVKMEIKRDKENIEVTVKASTEAPQLDLYNREEAGALQEIEDSIYYVDLHRFNDLEKQLDTLLNAKGVIIDIRDFRWDSKTAGYMEEIIARLTDKPVQSPIARVMKTIYPDQKHVTFDELPRYSNQPKDPKFKGEVVFLTFAGNLSNPEFLLGQIKDNQLATIIGQPTAGSDGNIQAFDIPGNLTGVFTGMEILNDDRTQTHMVGIQPDILVERTVEGIRNEEDEYITRALEYITEEN